MRILGRLRYAIMINSYLKCSRVQIVSRFVHSKIKPTSNKRISFNVYEDLVDLSSLRIETKFNSNTKNTFVIEDQNSFAVLSDDEFLSILQPFLHANDSLGANKKASLKFSKVENEFSLLKNECLSRLTNFNNNCIFQCANILLLNNNKNIYFNNFYNEFMNVVNKLLMYSWQRVIQNKHDFLLLIFFLNKSTSVNTTSTFHNMETFLINNISSFNTSEVAFVCHIFFSTNSRLQQVESLKSIRQFTLTNISTFKLSDLNNILKVFRHSGFADTQFFFEISKHLHTKIFHPSCNFTHLSNLAFTYASLKLHNQKLMQNICKSFQEKTSQSSKPPRFKDLTRLCWSLGQLQTPTPPSIITLLSNMLQSDTNLAFVYPETYIEGVLGLAMLRLFPPNPYQVILSQKFLSFKSKRPLENNFQLLLLKTLADIHLPTNNNNLLTSPIPGLKGDLKYELMTRQGLLPLVDTISKMLSDWCKFKVHFVLDCSRIADIEIHMDTKGNMTRFNKRPENINNKINKDTNKKNNNNNNQKSATGNIDNTNDSESFQDLLQECLALKRPQSVKDTSADESIMKRVMKKDSFLINRPGKADDYKDIHIPSKNSSSNKFIIKVMGSNQYSSNNLLGIHQLELDMLHQLDYHLYIINPYKAFLLENDGEDGRSRDVREIFEALNIKL